MWGCPDLISKSLIFISTGSNDLFEYADCSGHWCKHNDTEFLQSLVASYTRFLKVFKAGGFNLHMHICFSPNEMLHKFIQELHRRF